MIVERVQRERLQTFYNNILDEGVEKESENRVASARQSDFDLTGVDFSHPFTTLATTAQKKVINATIFAHKQPGSHRYRREVIPNLPPNRVP